MSTAWYRSNCVPRCVKAWKSRNKTTGSLLSSIQVWDTTCVVHNMPTTFQVLLNPANPQMSGVSKFPYFPVGGPQPPEGFAINKDTHPIMGYVSQWGGMDTGAGMVFSANVVDGLVHQMGGKALQSACQQALREQHGVSQLQEGQAIMTRSVGKLEETTSYRYILHVVPPFFLHEHNTSIANDVTTEQVLAQTYINALRLASSLKHTAVVNNDDVDVADDDDDDDSMYIATPLLGAGCRGFPVLVAVKVAAQTLNELLLLVDPAISPSTRAIHLAFGVPNREIRQHLVNAIDVEHRKLQPM